MSLAGIPEARLCLGGAANLVACAWIGPDQGHPERRPLSAEYQSAGVFLSAEHQTIRVPMTFSSRGGFHQSLATPTIKHPNPTTTILTLSSLLPSTPHPRPSTFFSDAGRHHSAAQAVAPPERRFPLLRGQRGVHREREGGDEGVGRQWAHRQRVRRPLAEDRERRRLHRLSSTNRRAETIESAVRNAVLKPYRTVMPFC